MLSYINPIYCGCKQIKLNFIFFWRIKHLSKYCIRNTIKNITNCLSKHNKSSVFTWKNVEQVAEVYIIKIQIKMKKGITKFNFMAALQV